MVERVIATDEALRLIELIRITWAYHVLSIWRLL